MNKLSKKQILTQIILVVGLFLTWRFFDFLIVFLSPKFIPYLGEFPYLRQLILFGNRFFSHFGNFDGIHYLLIAKNGYSQYEQAFFPLFPLLIRYLTPLFGNELTSGIIISNLSLFAGIFLLKDSLSLKKTCFICVVVFLLSYPTSFFFGVVYTEGLFFLLIASTLYFLKKKRYLISGLFAILASLTRLAGVFLAIPIFFHLLEEYQISKIKFREFLPNIKNYLLTAPFIGLGAYCYYLYRTTGDPLYFLTSQPAFGANRSTHLIFLPQVYWRYFKIFVTAAHNFPYYISIVEFVFFNFVLIVLVLDLVKIIRHGKINLARLGLNLFSFANLLLPSLTGTFSSIPRYSLMSLSIFLYISEIESKWIKMLILAVFIIFHAILLGFFSQGYFVS